MRTKYLLLLLSITFLLSGCVFSPYKNSKYGEMAIDAWFNDKTLGKTRKKIENIDNIVSSDCTYLEHNENKYVFKCKITYIEHGETVIPLSKHSEIEAYVVFIKEEGNKFDSKVYSSTSKDEVWKTDEYLNY